jgi:hypothetical protein
LERKTFDLWHLGGQQLSKEDISELREFTIAGGYQPWSVLFGGVDEEILGCILYRVGRRLLIFNEKHLISKALSSYRKQHITGSLVYSNFKVQTLLLLPSLLVFKF